jgi:uncharacterized membrane protein
MNKTRLEAFSDGVIAIIITILVLELRIPHETSIKVLVDLIPEFMAYIMSFIYIGIYWVNHHHLVHTINQISGKIMWANFGLLFTLSLIPFSTGWMGENHFAQLPVALYSFNLLACAVSFYLLQQSILRGHTKDSKLISALRKQVTKGYISLVFYIVSLIFAFILPIVSAACFVIVAILWVVPDRNIEAALKDNSH